MDGRPHPPEHAPHTWMGFSTGRGTATCSIVETTHIKQGWHRRNGVPQSDRTTLTEHFIRHGNILTHIAVITRPGLPDRAARQEPELRAEPARAAAAQLAVAVPVGRRGRDARRGRRPALSARRESVSRRVRASRHACPSDGRARRRRDDVSGVRATLKGDNTPQRAAPTRRRAEHRRPRLRRAAAAPSMPRWHGARPRSPERRHRAGRDVHVQGNVHLLVGAGGNITVQVGDEGVLVVDSQFAQMSAEDARGDRDAVATKPIRYIVNTHMPRRSHRRQRGDRQGRPHARRRQRRRRHRRCRHTDTRRGHRARERAEADERADRGSRRSRLRRWPTDTFFNERKDMLFNGEAVQILHQPNAHTDGDIIVFFRRSDVIATGDLFITTELSGHRPRQRRHDQRPHRRRSTASSTSPCRATSRKAAR